MLGTIFRHACASRRYYSPNSMRGELVVADVIARSELGSNPDEVLTRAMAKQRGGDGSITLLRPDGIPARLSRAGVYPVLGLRPLTATITSGFRTLPLRIAQLRSCAASVQKLPAGDEDGRPDFATRRLCRRRSNDADRSSDRTGRRRLGHEQLAGYR
jgi:hypothetical protein